MKNYEEMSIVIFYLKCEDIVCASPGVFEDTNVDDDGWTKGKQA